MSLQKSITTYPVLVIAESSQDSPVFVVLYGHRSSRELHF